jgi:hypothetical protein
MRCKRAVRVVTVTSEDRLRLHTKAVATKGRMGISSIGAVVCGIPERSLISTSISVGVTCLRCSGPTQTTHCLLGFCIYH